LSWFSFHHFFSPRSGCQQTTFFLPPSFFYPGYHRRLFHHHPPIFQIHQSITATHIHSQMATKPPPRLSNFFQNSPSLHFKSISVFTFSSLVVLP